MAGISSKAAGGVENKFKFNDATERTTDFDLNWDETDFRSYDPQIGRFHQIDPLGGITDNWSPYSFVQNNPILYNDPLGLDTLKTNVPLPPNVQPGQVVNVPNAGGGTSSYIYDPNNPNADAQGLVENGMTGPNLEEVVVSTTKKKDDSSTTTNQSSSTSVDNTNNEQLVLPVNRWRTQAPDWSGCFRTSQIIAGYTAPRNLAILTARENGRAIQTLPAAQQGVQTINAYLAANRPIIVGVHHTFGRTYNEGTTDHFVVIVGSGYTNGMMYYRFYDPGTLRAAAGASPLNRLYLRANFSLTGTTQYNGRTYTVSQVRPAAR